MRENITYVKHEQYIMPMEWFVLDSKTFSPRWVIQQPFVNFLDVYRGCFTYTHLKSSRLVDIYALNRRGELLMDFGIFENELGLEIERYDSSLSNNY